MRLGGHVIGIVCSGAVLAWCALAQSPGIELTPPVRPDPPAPTGPPDARAQRVLLGRVRLESLRYQRELPDFICDQLTTRSVDDGGTGKHWKQRDKLQV